MVEVKKKKLDKGNLRKKGFILVQCILDGKSQKWELEGASPVASYSGTENNECMCASAQPDFSISYGP